MGTYFSISRYMTMVNVMVELCNFQKDTFYLVTFRYVFEFNQFSCFQKSIYNVDQDH